MKDNYNNFADAPLTEPPANEGAAGNNGADHTDAHPDGPPVARDAAGQYTDGPPIAHAPGTAFNPIADGVIDGLQPASAAVLSGSVGHVAPPPALRSAYAVAAPNAVAYATSRTDIGGSGIVAGDSELMPPRFSGDGKVDAHQWAKQFRNYLRMRQVTPEFAALLLENRLTGTAAQWLENQPEGLTIDDVMARFVRKFEINQRARNQLFAAFWTRRQGKDETARDYMENMQTMARKLRLNDEALVVQGIIQGLIPEVQRDVVLQNPTSYEALTIAAEIGERNAKLTAKPASPAQPTSDIAAYQANVNRLEATIDTMQQMIVSDRRAAVATVNTVGAQPVLGTPSQQLPSYTGAAAPGRAPFRARSRGRGLRGTAPADNGNHDR